MAGLSAAGKADAGAFLSRLVHLDPAALVRLRPAGERVALWARLPWDVLVTRVVEADTSPGDITLSADALLRDLDIDLDGDVLPPRRDILWRWPLPSQAGDVIERIPAGEIRRVGAAAAQALRAVGGTADRGVRETLLDHVPIVVEASGQRVEVVQRLVQAVLRMGFLGAQTPLVPGAPVAVRVAPGWVAMAAGYGTAWRRTHIHSLFAYSNT